MDQIQEKLQWFQSVILIHRRALRGRLRYAVRSENELDDLCSEVLTRAYSVTSWERITAGRAFLFSIARNLMIDLARRREVVAFEAMPDAGLVRDRSDAEAQLIARDELRRLHAIVEQLPPQPRRAFLLRRAEEKSLAEIAEEMNLSVSTVEKHLAKALLLVMAALARVEDRDFDGFSFETGRTRQDRTNGGAPVRQAVRHPLP